MQAVSSAALTASAQAHDDRLLSVCGLESCAFVSAPIPTVSHEPLALFVSMLCPCAVLSAPEWGDALKLYSDALADETAALTESLMELGLTDACCVSCKLLALWPLFMAGIFGDAGSLVVLCLSCKEPFACDAVDTESRGFGLLLELQVCALVLLSALLDTNSGASGLKAYCITGCAIDGLCAALCLLSSC